MLLNFNSSNVNATLQAKQELVREAGVDVSDSEGPGVGRKRRQEQEYLSQTQMGMGSYLLQSSTTGSIPATHSPNPATFWMLTNPSTTQVMSSGDPMWTFPSGGNNTANAYRGSMTTNGLHFMNFSPPMALLPPGQQFGTGIGGAGGGTAVTDSHLGVLAALNAYRPIVGGSALESPASGGHPHHGGDDGSRNS